MAHHQSNFNFKLMSFEFALRDFLIPRMKVLSEVGIKPGFHVLDYGCGPGSYILPLAELVGSSGKIYALDIHPLAIQKLQTIVRKNKLPNVETIHSDSPAGLPDGSVDVVLMYDVFHGLQNPDMTLREISRVLKPNGVLSFSDHHLKEEDIISQVSKSGLFHLSGKGKKTYRFVK